MKKTFTIKDKHYSLLTIILLIIAWQVIAIWLDNELIIPSPSTVFMTLWTMLQQPDFYRRVAMTLMRSLEGFVLALAIGALLAMLAAKSNFIRHLLAPLISIQRAMPTMAIILLAVIWLTRHGAAVLVSFLIVFPLIYSGFLASLIQVENNYLQVGQVFNFSRRKMLMAIYLPSILISVQSVLIGAISLCVKVTIAAEVLSQPKYGIGTALLIEKSTLNTAGVVAWAIIVIVIATVLEMLIGLLFEKILV